jgi:DNA-binding MarR family transcriptional regulator
MVETPGVERRQDVKELVLTNASGRKERPLALERPIRKRRARAGGGELNLGPLAALLGFHLRRAQLAVFEDLRRDAPVPRLAPGQFRILAIIDSNPDLTQRELGEGIGLDKSTFAISLDVLAGRGLIRRVRSVEDRRRNTLRLTTKGAATLKAMFDHVARHEQRVFSTLSAAERETLFGLLKRIGEQRVAPPASPPQRATVSELDQRAVGRVVSGGRVPGTTPKRSGENGRRRP